jgi:hypothetical protein
MAVAALIVGTAKASTRRLCERYGASFATGVLPRRVWNGIFGAGDWRAKRDVNTMSPHRDQKSETTTREKWRKKGFSASELSVAGFAGLGGGGCSPSETGLQV